MPHFIKVPVSNMHHNPDLDSEMVSQAIYSEEIRILDSKSEWSHIQTDEGFNGWIFNSHLIERDPLQKTYILGSSFNHIYKVKDTTPHLPLTTLPFLAKIECVNPHHEERWLDATLIDGTPCYVQQGDLWKQPSTLSIDEIIDLGKKFLGLPYTWGGKSSFGFDCSGLIQTLFRFKNILLPRNSIDQSRHSSLKTISEQELQKGDLIFFGKVVFHVGLVIENNQFLHATVARLRTQTTIHPLSEIFETFEHRLCKRLTLD